MLAFASGSSIWACASAPGHGRGSPQFAADGSPLLGAAPLGDVLLLTAHEDGCVRRWDSRAPAAPDAVFGRRGGAPVVALAAARDKVVAGGADGTVRLWDALSGEDMGVTGHVAGAGGSAAVAGVGVCDDLWVSAGRDGAVRVWAPEAAADA